MQMAEIVPSACDHSETDMNKNSDMTRYSGTPRENSTTESNNTNVERPVGAVADDIIVTTKAKAQILATGDLKTLDIRVKTLNGEVTLTCMA